MLDAMKQAKDFISRLKFADAEPEPEIVMGVLDKAIAELENQDGACQHCAEKGCVACDARKQEPVKVSPLEFVEMVMEKEHLIGKPIFWAEWPNKEKSDVAQETNS